MTNSTNVVGEYYTSGFTSASPQYSISQSALPVTSFATRSIILSDGVTTVTGYQIAANSGDIVLRSGNATNGFSGPEVTLAPTVGAQNGLSLVPLPNDQFVALVQTDPTGTNYDIIGYTLDKNLTVLQGPYPVNTNTTGAQGSPSGALYGDGKLGYTYYGSQTGANIQYGGVLNPTTGANIVPDYAFKVPPIGTTQASGVCTALKGGNIANAWIEGSTLKVAVTTSSGGLVGSVTQFNNAGITVLNQNQFLYITATDDGNFVVEYSALPVIPGNQGVYYSVGSPTGSVLSSDTQIPTSTNAQVASGILGLPGSNLGATFVGSSGTGQPGLIGTVIQNTAPTTAPTIVPTTPPSGGTTPPSGGTTPPSGGTTPPSGGTTPPSGGTTPPSGGTTPPSGGTTPPSGITTIPPSIAPTTAPTHSGASSLQPPFISVYKGIGSIVSGGARLAGWLLGK